MNNWRSPKDWEIFITAITKSVIESGAPKEEWEDRVRHGCRIVMNLVNAALAKDGSSEAKPH